MLLDEDFDLPPPVMMATFMFAMVIIRDGYSCASEISCKWRETDSRTEP